VHAVFLKGPSNSCRVGGENRPEAKRFPSKKYLRREHAIQRSYILGTKVAKSEQRANQLEFLAINHGEDKKERGGRKRGV